MEMRRSGLGIGIYTEMLRVHLVWMTRVWVAWMGIHLLSLSWSRRTTNNR